MTTIAIAIAFAGIAIAAAFTGIAIAAFYSIVLSKTEEPELTNEELAEMSVSKEWWQVD
jgi:membrane associated rhomboid family serine protease